MNRSSRYHGNRDVVPDVDDYERSAKRRKEDRSVTGSSSGQVIDPQFRTLCLSQFNQRVSDDEITSAIFQEFKKFGEFTVKIIYSGSRRLAYVDFQFADDAFAAKQLFQDKLVMFDTPIRVDVVYSTKPPPPRNHSPSPPDVGPRGDGYRRSSPYASRAKEGNGGYDGPREPVAYHDRGPQQRESRYQGHQQQQQQTQLPPEDDETATRTLFVGNLDFNVTAEELQQVFNRFGIVEDVDVKRAAAGSGAYAFIRFFHLDMAYYAKVEMSGRLIGHHQCRIGYGKATPSNCLWVGGIGPWLTPETLGRIFGRHAPVQRVEWPPGMNYAYVQFNTTEDARLAMNAMRGAPLGGQDRRIRIDFADVTQITSPMNLPRNGRRDTDPLPPASRPWPADRREPDPDLDRRTLCDDHRHSSRGEAPDDGARGSRQYRSTSPDRRGSDRHSSELRPMEPEILDITNVAELANKLPVVWSGVFMLKNSAFATRLHLVDGDVRLVDALMRDPSTTERTSLKITQRLRLDDSKLGEVRRRISLAGPSGCAVLLALPSADSGTSADQLHRPLKNLVTYLRQKDAAGVILLPPTAGSGSGRSSHRDSGLLHAFPPCDFARQQLTRRAPRLSTGSPSADDYLVVIVVRLNS